MADTEVTVLVTGFGPFGEHTINPSGQLARQLDGVAIGGARIVGRQWETATATVGTRLIEALDEIRPAALICLGLASGRPAMSLERVAINVRDFPIPDNDRAQVSDEPVVPGGPDGLFTGLPIKTILRQWHDAEIPGHVSGSAGTYLCNQLFYLACAQGRARGIPAGFIHLPDTPRSAGTANRATMELSTMERGLRIAVAATLAGDTEPRLPAGATA
jgi:pyroglutamyl-peptidase